MNLNANTICGGIAIGIAAGLTLQASNIFIHRMLQIDRRVDILECREILNDSREGTFFNFRRPTK